MISNELVQEIYSKEPEPGHNQIPLTIEEFIPLLNLRTEDSFMNKISLILYIFVYNISLKKEMLNLQVSYLLAISSTIKNF